MVETRGLGKGIRALIPENKMPQTQLTGVQKLPVSSIEANPFQPRKHFDDTAIHDLADSIKESGLIYPILVRKTEQSGSDSPKYQIVAGERRFRALQLLGEEEVPVLIQELEDQKALELALVENVQREDLNPLEEAQAFERLQAEFGFTQEQVAQAVGKSRAAVTNSLRLLKLSEAVQEKLRLGQLSMGHARALLALELVPEQEALAERIVSEGLSVRRVERLVKEKDAVKAGKQPKKQRDPNIVEVEQKLQRALGTHVQLSHGKTRGWIKVSYYSLKDLDRLISRLT